LLVLLLVLLIQANAALMSKTCPSEVFSTAAGSGKRGVYVRNTPLGGFLCYRFDAAPTPVVNANLQINNTSDLSRYDSRQLAACGSMNGDGWDFKIGRPKAKGHFMAVSRRHHSAAIIAKEGAAAQKR
jgi:hypothetical protein